MQYSPEARSRKLARSSTDYTNPMQTVKPLPLPSSIKCRSRSQQMLSFGRRKAIKPCSPSHHIERGCGWASSYSMPLRVPVPRSSTVCHIASWPHCPPAHTAVYIVSLYQNLGLSGGVPLIIGAVYVTVATLGNYVGALILDRFGRKRLFIIGLTGCMLSVCLETAMIAQFAGTTNKTGLSFGVFFSFCFISFYGSCIDVVGYVYVCEWTYNLQANSADIQAEIFPTHIRPQGVAWALVGTFLSTLVYVEAAPTALANIQWKYYIIFVILTFINIIIVYFWCPEVSICVCSAGRG